MYKNSFSFKRSWNAYYSSWSGWEDIFESKLRHCLRLSSHSQRSSEDSNSAPEESALGLQLLRVTCKCLETWAARAVTTAERHGPQGLQQGTYGQARWRQLVMPTKQGPRNNSAHWGCGTSAWLDITHRCQQSLVPQGEGNRDSPQWCISWNPPYTHLPMVDLGLCFLCIKP